jgi:acetyl esterase/lipase
MTNLKYASLADPAPEWLSVKEVSDAQFNAFFALPLEQQQSIWAAQPHPLPDGTPVDLEVSYKKVPVRDGAQIGIKIYRNTTKLSEMAKTKAPLVVVAHGGGWVLGNHDVEEGVCRWISHETGAVVVDVDFRL